MAVAHVHIVHANCCAELETKVNDFLLLIGNSNKIMSLEIFQCCWTSYSIIACNEHYSINAMIMYKD